MNRALARFHLVGLLLLLGGCSSLPRETAVEAVYSPSPALQQLASALPGNYGNFAQVWAENRLDASSAHWRLRVSVLARENQRLWLLFDQRLAGRPEVQRMQVFKIESLPDGRLVLQFAPLARLPKDVNPQTLGAASRFIPGCEVPLTLTPAGVAGQTRPQQCQLGSQWLTKDILLSNQEIAVAERVSDHGADPSESDTHISRFSRTRHYEGWAGSPHHIADDNLQQTIRLSDDGDSLPLQSASNGERDGYRIRLARIPWKESEPDILRLDILDRSGSPIAYAWAPANAESIGLNLNWIQVGLQRSR